MDEQKLMEKFESEGYDKVWVYEASPGEIDEEHSHDFDSRLLILKGTIEITAPMYGKIETLSHSTGSDTEILRNTPHSAKVGPEGCRYIVAEKYYI